MPISEVDFGRLMQAVETLTDNVNKHETRLAAMENWRSGWGGLAQGCMILGGVATFVMMALEVWARVH